MNVKWETGATRKHKESPLVKNTNVNNQAKNGSVHSPRKTQNPLNRSAGPTSSRPGGSKGAFGSLGN